MWSYIQDSGDFIYKMKRIAKVLEGSSQVTADVVSLYPRILHKESILALKKKIEEQTPPGFLLMTWLDKQNLFSKKF